MHWKRWQRQTTKSATSAMNCIRHDSALFGQNGKTCHGKVSGNGVSMLKLHDHDIDQLIDLDIWSWLIGVRKILQWGGELNIRPPALPTWLLMNKQHCVNDMSPVLLLYWWTVRQQLETKIIIIIYHYLGYENYWATIFWLCWRRLMTCSMWGSEPPLPNPPLRTPLRSRPESVRVGVLVH